jgi:hypothetical protein
MQRNAADPTNRVELSGRWDLALGDMHNSRPDLAVDVDIDIDLDSQAGPDAPLGPICPLRLVGDSSSTERVFGFPGRCRTKVSETR